MRIFVLFALLLAVSCSGNGEPAADTLHAEDSGDASAVDGQDSGSSTDLSEDLGLTDQEQDVCVPQCEERNCGPDGCGGLCGKCVGLQICLDGVCCNQDCVGKDCGPDGCGGSCGSCEDPAVCLDGLCCSPACDGKDCGPDGCGGSCGSCIEGKFCMMGKCSLPDSDLDSIPDLADMFPMNPDLPGKVLPEKVYAHTADTLWSMDIKIFQLTEIGMFVWPDDGYTHKMTDIGIDGYGVLYGTSYEYLYTCHPQTLQCSFVGELPEAFNALTLVPAPLLDPVADVLVGISEEGGWYRFDIQGTQVGTTKLGTYGPGYTSAGDAYSITGIGTFAAVHKEGAPYNVLVSVDPVNGKVTSEVGPITGYVGIFGLAGWTGRAYAFDKTGAVLKIDTATSEVEIIHDTETKWWGAGVATRVE